MQPRSEEEIYRAICAAKRAGQKLTIDITQDAVRLTIGQPDTAPIPAPQLKEILKIPDLARHWNISTSAVRQMIDTGQIAAFRIGRLIRIRREEVERIDGAKAGNAKADDWTEAVKRF